MVIKDIRWFEECSRCFEMSLREYVMFRTTGKGRIEWFIYENIWKIQKPSSNIRAFQAVEILFDLANSRN